MFWVNQIERYMPMYKYNKTEEKERKKERKKKKDRRMFWAVNSY